MNVGVNTGIPASMAGIPIAQNNSSEADRTRVENAAQRRANAAEAHAEKAAGIGPTDGEDNAIDDRDADGRRPWEFKHIAKPQAKGDTERQSRDSTGESGGQLDVTG